MKPIVKSVAFTSAQAVGFVAITKAVVLSGANGGVYSRTEGAPAVPIAIILGSSPYLNDVKNPYLEHRLDAAAALFHSGKVQNLRVSGDNSTRAYDEPTAMKEGLMARGRPGGRHQARFRRIPHARFDRPGEEVVGVHRCAIVTDDFHVPRALYLASSEGLGAVGFQSEPVPRSSSPWTRIREIGARSLVWLDLHILNRQAAFSDRKIRSSSLNHRREVEMGSLVGRDERL